MGIAKTMSAIGEYNFFSPDYHQFIVKLEQLFHVNIHASFYDHVYVDVVEPKEIEDKNFDFNFLETYNLHVDIFTFGSFEK